MLTQQIQKGESKKLELKKEPNFVSMVFYRKTAEKVSNNVEKPAESDEYRRIPTNTDELSLEELKIIDFLEQNQKITVKDVQNLLTLKTTQSKEILYSLAEKNYIKKIGKTRGSYYTSNRVFIYFSQFSCF